MEQRPTDTGPAAEADGWARLAADVVDGVVSETVQGVHRAVADRAFGAVGPLGAPVRLVHDVVLESVYATVRGSLRGLGVVGGMVAAARARDQQRPWLDRSSAGSRLAAIANGLLDEVPSALRLPLAIRQAGVTVDAEAAALAAAFPDATTHVVVFVHGLTEDDRIWDPPPERPGRVSLPTALGSAGTTPVRVRYGTGAAVGRNGAALTQLLEHLVQHWPVPIAQLTLVGHSMGGLVVRSACAQAAERGHSWTRALRHVAYLGTPHLGAPLERVVERAVGLFGRVPEVAPFVGILDRRAPGIRDLHHGTLVDPGQRLREVVEPDADDPWLADVDHHLVVGRLARGERHPVNRVLGDLLVPASSATGRGRTRRIEGERVHVVPVAANHFGLCWHPDVADHLVRHLTDTDTAV
ncbi:alpha/beta hydrolase [Egicoccus halophilus]|uniref:DUF676 domain-containing protein n=1 Tax=Egicoccus halophilus TaxID=1670830 RepID=A0A8J3ESH9_9ACTN|nr:alpha/beta hydrolase [Egicoccus halophilus]GGI02775.1 hypothetical protein GCM10011354_01500 [Egicoccus halophilus]